MQVTSKLYGRHKIVSVEEIRCKHLQRLISLYYCSSAVIDSLESHGCFDTDWVELNYVEFLIFLLVATHQNLTSSCFGHRPESFVLVPVSKAAAKPKLNLTPQMFASPGLLESSFLFSGRKGFSETRWSTQPQDRPFNFSSQPQRSLSHGPVDVLVKPSEAREVQKDHVSSRFYILRV